MKTDVQKSLIRQIVERTVVQPYTTKELAQIFNMSSRTLRRNIAGIRDQLGKKRMGYFFCVEQVRIIFEHMGGAPFELLTVVKEIPMEVPPNSNVTETKVVTMWDQNYQKAI